MNEDLKDYFNDILRKINSYDNKNKIIMEPDITKKEIRKYLEQTKKAYPKNTIKKAIIYGIYYSKGIYDELSESAKDIIKENEGFIKDIQNSKIEIKKGFVFYFEILKNLHGYPNRIQFIKYIEKELKKQ